MDPGPDLHASLALVLHLQDCETAQRCPWLIPPCPDTSSAKISLPTSNNMACHRPANRKRRRIRFLSSRTSETPSILDVRQSEDTSKYLADFFSTCRQARACSDATSTFKRSFTDDEYLLQPCRSKIEDTISCRNSFLVATSVYRALQRPFQPCFHSASAWLILSALSLCPAQPPLGPSPS